MVGKINKETSDRLRAALPAQHAKFLQSLATSFSHGRFFLCHAGVRPGVPLERQRDKDLLWIREEFLSSKMDFGKIVVHGHTPTAEPEGLAMRCDDEDIFVFSNRPRVAHEFERGFQFSFIERHGYE
jgi:serine/threonine protein phosphatase 1